MTKCAGWPTNWKNTHSGSRSVALIQVGCSLAIVVNMKLSNANFQRKYFKKFNFIATCFLCAMSVIAWRTISVSVMNDVTENKIVPFSLNEIGPSTDANRTLKWLDLWGSDENCTKFDVTLLEDKSIQPRALVSFPGSGNTWLRMLLMGITGIYINSVYGGDDAFFESKGSLLT